MVSQHIIYYYYKILHTTGIAVTKTKSPGGEEDIMCV